jgi:hypothetical protein
VTKQPKQVRKHEKADEEFARYLAVIELDDDYIEGLRELVGNRHSWFLDAASGAIAGLTEAARGRAAFIFGRLAAKEELSALARLAEHDLPLVRGNAIGAMATLEDRAATNMLANLAADRSRPLIDRMQALSAIRLRPVADTIERLRAMDLTGEAEELQFRVELLLEELRSRSDAG